MNCCNVNPVIDRSYPVMIDEKPYLIQILKCANPQCERFGQDILELRHDFLHPEHEIITIELS